MTSIVIGHNSDGKFIEDGAVSLSDRGYEFQFYFMEQLLTRLAGFATVTLEDMKGNEITLDNFRKRGKDGGLDLIIKIKAKTAAAAKAVETKVWNIISSI